MATITTHVLNGVAGTHAAGVSISLVDTASGAILFSGATDAGGRLQQEIPAESIDPATSYDLVFAVADYWARQGLAPTAAPAVTEFVFRFAMTQPEGRYHIPLSMSPHSHAVWWTG